MQLTPILHVTASPRCLHVFGYGKYLRLVLAFHVLSTLCRRRMCLSPYRKIRCGKGHCYNLHLQRDHWRVLVVPQPLLVEVSL